MSSFSFSPSYLVSWLRSWPRTDRHTSWVGLSQTQCFLTIFMHVNIGYWARQYDLVDDPSEVNVPL